MKVRGWLAPSLVTVSAELRTVAPESASWHDRFTVTSVLFQPLMFAAGVCEELAVGAVRSILTVTLCDAAPPWLDAVHVRVVPAALVSELNVLLPQPEDVTVDSGSLTVKLTVTGPLFQPLAFGSG